MVAAFVVVDGIASAAEELGSVVAGLAEHL